MKVTLTESKLNSIIAESIKRVLKEGYFDGMNMHEGDFFGGFDEGGKQKHNKEKVMHRKEKQQKKAERKQKQWDALSDVGNDEIDKGSRNKDKKDFATKRKRVISRLKSDKVDVAQYAYSLWPDKDEDSARSYFYKCLDGKKNDAGDVYNFSDDEINRLYSLLANEIG